MYHQWSNNRSSGVGDKEEENFHFIHVCSKLYLQIMEFVTINKAVDQCNGKRLFVWYQVTINFFDACVSEKHHYLAFTLE